MSYVAKHYVKISGRRFTPGEIIDMPIPEEKLLRLLRLRAIVRQPDAIDDPDDGKGEDEAKDAHQTAKGQSEDSSAIPSDSLQDETPEDEEKRDEAEEEHAPEIDVMDGIVSAAKEAEKEDTQKKTTGKGRKKA